MEALSARCCVSGYRQDTVCTLTCICGLEGKQDIEPSRWHQEEEPGGLFQKWLNGKVIKDWLKSSPEGIPESASKEERGECSGDGNSMAQV